MSEPVADSTTVDDFENIGNTGDPTSSPPATQDDFSTAKTSGCCFTECSFLKAHPEFRDLIYWRCPIKTGIVLGSSVVLLISLLFLSVISVVAYAGLSLLCCTFGWRLYHDIMANVRKTSAGSHPFQAILEKDYVLPTDQIVEMSGKASDKVNEKLRRVRDMILVKNYVDTLKLVVFLYVMTIVGSWFNLTTLVFMVVITLFSLPKTYELYNPQIDQGLKFARGHVMKVWDQVREKLSMLPIFGKKEKTT